MILKTLKLEFSNKNQRHSQNRKKNSIGIRVFGYENKEKHPIYVSKNAVKKNMLIFY